MTLEVLQEDWLTLLGKEGLELALPAATAKYDVNHLAKFATNKGLQGHCKYLLSERFEHCGLFDDARQNITPVLHASMCRAMDAAIAANAPECDMDVLVVPSPYREFGAEVTCTPNGYLVMVSPITLPFCFLYAILAVTSAQATGLMRQALVVRDETGKEVIDPLEWVYMSHRALSDAVAEFLRTGTITAPMELIRSARFDLLPWHYTERIQRTYEQMLDFLLLHEFGHIVLNHMKGAGTVRRAIPGTTVTYEVIAQMVTQEEQADDFAVRCLVGASTAAELDEFSSLLDQGSSNLPKLDKFWAGRTSIARFTSSLQLLKLFDLIENHRINHQSGFHVTNECEIGSTHPSGQHRMIRAMAASPNILQLPEGYKFNHGNIWDWQNLANITAWNPDKASVLRMWESIR